MTPRAVYYAWMMTRALIWIGAISLLIRHFTRERRVVAAYWGAHLAALLLGCGVDILLWDVVGGTAGSVQNRQAIFVAPIAIFTVISLWIGSWRVSQHASDALMTVVPLVLYAGLVIKGWNARGAREFPDVLGAWFVSAASGGLDLIAIYGPPQAVKRRTLLRLAGYAGIALVVYALLPFTE